MKKYLSVIIILICTLLCGCTNSKNDFNVHNQPDVECNKKYISTENLTLSENFDLLYKFNFSYTGYKIENSQLWIEIDFGDEMLRASLIGYWTEIAENDETIRPLEIVTDKDGLSEMSDAIYYDKRGIVDSMSDTSETKYRITIQLSRYGNKICCKVFQPAVQLVPLATQATICNFVYIYPGDLPENVDFRIIGDAVEISDIEYVDYPKMTKDPELSMWPDEKMSDNTDASIISKIIRICIFLAVAIFSVWLALTIQSENIPLEIDFSLKKSILLSVCSLLSVAGISYCINPYGQMFLYRRFCILFNIGYGTPIADSARWIIYSVTIISLIITLVISISAITKAKKIGESATILIWIFLSGLLCIPIVLIALEIVIEIFKVIAGIVAFLIFGFFMANTKMDVKRGKATITDEYGNKREYDTYQYDGYSDIHVEGMNGLTTLKKEYDGEYKGDNGEYYKRE